MSAMNDAALVRQSEAPVAAQVSKAGIDPEIVALAAAIYTSAEGITKEQAVRAAYHFRTTGEVMGRDAYIGTQGAVKGQVIEGYRAIERTINQDFQVKYRTLRPDECDMHEIEPGDNALACEVYLLDTWAKCRKMGVPYEPIVGVTVLRKGSNQRVPTTKTLHWVMQKQARKDALRQIPGLALDADEVLDAADAAGIRVDVPEGAHPTREQAVALLESAAEKPAQRPTPEQAQATLARAQAERDADADYDDLEGAPESAHNLAPATPTQATPTQPPPDEMIPHPTVADAKAARPASIRTGSINAFNAAADAFAGAHPRYQDKTGSTNRFQVLRAAFAEGFESIDVENMAAVFAKLEARALSYEYEESMKAAVKVAADKAFYAQVPA